MDASSPEFADGAEFATRIPTACLRPLVRRYIGYRQEHVSLAVHRGLPSRSATLIISLADPVRLIGGIGTENGPRARQSVLGGLHVRPALIAQDRYQCGIHIELHPLGIAALLGACPRELSNTVCALEELPVPWGAELAPMLHGAPSWPERFAILDRVLSQGLRPVEVPAEVRFAWRALLAGQGTLGVGALAKQVGWSRRHLTQRFATAVGVTPKQAARLMRFERSTTLVRAGVTSSLAQLALDCGYYDQAHMSGEWREFAGCPPSTWIREELPFLQGSGTGDGAHSDP
ncbi:MAG: helix-turn-helix domain-containing protein [Sciscionella sp.]